MNRRELLYTAGTTGVLAVAGCISDDTGAQPEDDPDGGEGGNTDDGSSGNGDGTDNDEDDDSEGEPEANSDPIETARAFLEAFAEGEIDRINALIHQESEMEEVGEEAREELEERAVTVEDVELTEESGDVAVVAATLQVEGEEGSARTVPWELELRREGEEWRVWERRPGDRSRIPGPRVEFDIDHADSELVIRHEAGDTVAASELFVRGEGLAETGSWLELGGETSVESNSDPAVAAGDSVAVGVADEYEITIVWNDGTDSKVFLNAAGASESVGEGNAPPEVVKYLADADNFDGVVDATGKESVTVRNGEVGGQTFAFSPAAIRVDVGTTVTWEWVGDTAHSVTHEGGAFDSGILDGEGETFSHTFEEAGIYLYHCVPHKALGQKGAVIVEGSG
ncbi:MAG: halocyanin domain-containing protein [Halovenus sp.]